MGINVPETTGEGDAFIDALKRSKSTNKPLRKTSEMEEYRKLTVGVDSPFRDEDYDMPKTISSDK